MRPKAMTAAMLGALLAALAGCGPQALRIRNGEQVLPADQGSPGFLDRVSSQPRVSENDAYRGVLMLLDGQDKDQTFQQRTENLAARGMVDRSWTHDAARPLTRGRLAYMICRACDIRGGVVLHLTGPNPWYCLKELEYQRLMAPGTIFAETTGMEFVAVLGRADVLRRTGELPPIMEVAAGGN